MFFMNVGYIDKSPPPIVHPELATPAAASFDALYVPLTLLGLALFLNAMSLLAPAVFSFFRNSVTSSSLISRVFVSLVAWYIFVTVPTLSLSTVLAASAALLGNSSSVLQFIAVGIETPTETFWHCIDKNDVVVRYNAMADSMRWFRRCYDMKGSMMNLPPDYQSQCDVDTIIGRFSCVTQHGLSSIGSRLSSDVSRIWNNLSHGQLSNLFTGLRPEHASGSVPAIGRSFVAFRDGDARTPSQLLVELTRIIQTTPISTLIVYLAAIFAVYFMYKVMKCNSELSSTLCQPSNGITIPGTLLDRSVGLLFYAFGAYPKTVFDRVAAKELAVALNEALTELQRSKDRCAWLLENALGLEETKTALQGEVWNLTRHARELKRSLTKSERRSRVSRQHVANERRANRDMHQRAERAQRELDGLRHDNTVGSAMIDSLAARNAELDSTLARLRTGSGTPKIAGSRRPRPTGTGSPMTPRSTGSLSNRPSSARRQHVEFLESPASASVDSPETPTRGPRMRNGRSPLGPASSTVTNTNTHVNANTNTNTNTEASTNANASADTNTVANSSFPPCYSSLSLALAADDPFHVRAALIRSRPLPPIPTGAAAQRMRPRGPRAAVPRVDASATAAPSTPACIFKGKVRASITQSVRRVLANKENVPLQTES